jgi:hypothetical protein
MPQRLPTRLRRLPLLALLGSCSGRPTTGAPASDGAPAASETPTAAAPADSLLLRAPRGVELWYTFAREDHDSAGGSCLERALEIRAGDRRVPVPLLYTRDLPRLVNESTVSARIWNRCAPGDEYRVNLRTGQPARASK